MHVKIVMYVGMYEQVELKGEGKKTLGIENFVRSAFNAHLHRSNVDRMKGKKQKV